MKMSNSNKSNSLNKSKNKNPYPLMHSASFIPNQNPNVNNNAISDIRESQLMDKINSNNDNSNNFFLKQNIYSFKSKYNVLSDNNNSNKISRNFTENVIFFKKIHNYKL